MGDQVLSTRALNRAVLARQLLLERADLGVVEALERVAGLQTQYAPSGYIGLWSRLAGFARGDLTAALERRELVQATLMRATIHVVSARDYPLFAEGVRRARRAWWQSATRHRGLDHAEVEAAAAEVRALLAHGPLRRTALVTALEEAGHPRELWEGVGLHVDLVRVPPSGTWERRRADLYGLAEDWLPTAAVSEAEGLAHLVRRYLGGFGPAAPADIANWAGVTATTLKPVLAGLALRRFRDQAGGELLDVADGLLPDPDTPVPVRFLSTWDANLLVHVRRAQILPEAYRGLVFHVKNPHSTPTFLVDGAVAGAWRYAGGRVQLEPYGPLAAADLEALEHEAAGLAAFHEDG